jgi:hypothetical protein
VLVAVPVVRPSSASMLLPFSVAPGLHDSSWMAVGVRHATGHAHGQVKTSAWV